MTFAAVLIRVAFDTLVRKTIFVDWIQMLLPYLNVNSALHPYRVAKSSTSFGWGKGGKVTAAGW